MRSFAGAARLPYLAALALIAPAVELDELLAISALWLACRLLRPIASLQPLLFGMGIPLLARFDPALLSVHALFFLLFAGNRPSDANERGMLPAGRPWLVVIGLHTAVAIAGGLWYAVGGGELSVSRLSAADVVPFVRDALPWIQWWLLLCLWSECAPRAHSGTIVRGLAVGTCISCAVAWLQFAGYLAGGSTAVDAFWVNQQRYAGLFSDPNALGVWCAMLLPLALGAALSGHGTARILFGATALAVLSTAPLSGSRSFFVGLAVIVAAHVMSGMVTFRRGAALGGIAAVFVVLLGFFSTSLSGASRLFATLDPATMWDSLLSRRVFWVLGWNMWLEAPLFGVGWGSFREWVPHMARCTPLPDAGWTDNSNNFFLGVLAETGIVGLVALAVLVAGMRRHAHFTVPGAVLCVFALAAMLLFGPHTDFPEIALLAGLAAGWAFEQPRIALGRRARSLAWLCVALPLLVTLVLRESGSERAWALTGRDDELRLRGGGGGGLWVACSADGVARLEVGSGGSLAARLRSECGEELRLTLVNGAWRHVALSCACVPPQTSSGARPLRVVVSGHRLPGHATKGRLRVRLRGRNGRARSPWGWLPPNCQS